MKSPNLSHDSYSDSMALAAALMPAHSGPELASCVPNAQLAQELARSLLSEQFELTRFDTCAASSYAASSYAGAGFTIGLARR